MERPPLRATLLGPFRVELEDRVVERWERPSARRLLQFLLLDPRRSPSRDELIEALFPALDAERGAAALSKAISMARAAVGAAAIESTRDYVRLAVDAETDLQHALAALEQALRGEPSTEALRAALAITGEPVPEERYADWPEPARTRLADLRRRCRFALASSVGREQSGPAAAVAWEEALAVDPTNEDAAAAAVTAHAAAGRRARAAQVFEACRTALADELGVEPSAALVAAYRQAVYSAGSPDAEAAAWLQLGRERLRDQDIVAAESAFGRALEAATDDEVRVEAWMGLASVPYRHGDMAAVIDICRMALDAISGVAAPARARLLAELGWAEVRAGRPEQGRPQLERAAEMLRENPGGDPDLRARTLDRLGICRSECGDQKAALEAAQEAFKVAPPARPHLAAVLRLHRGQLLGRSGRAAEGLGDVSAARRVFAARGDDYSTSVTHWAAAELLDRLGLPERALAEREAEVALLAGIENPRNLAGALIHGAELLRRLGRRELAETWSQRALEAALQSGDSRLIEWARERSPWGGKVSGKPGA